MSSQGHALTPGNTPSGPREVASSVSSQVPVFILPSVAPVLTLTSYTSVLVLITDRSPLAMSHKQPMDLPIGSDHPRSAFIEEVDDKDLPVPSAHAQPIGHTTVQHVNDSDFFNGSGLTSSQVPPPIKDPHEDLGVSDSDDDSLPFLGDPEPEFFGETTLPSISLIGAADFKWLIDAGEEVYTINIQPTSNYLDIMALRAISTQPTPMSTLHSEPLPTDKAELFAKVIPEVYHNFFDVFSREEAKNMPPHCEFDHQIHLENDQTPPHSHIYLLSGTQLGLLCEFIDDMLGKGFIRSFQSPGGAPILFAKKKDGTLWLCVDFRNLNKITKKDCYLIPLIANLLDQLGSAKVYTKLNLRAGYYNVRVAAGHKWKTAFQTQYGSFEFLVMRGSPTHRLRFRPS